MLRYANAEAKGIDPGLLDELALDYLDADRGLSYFTKAAWDILEPTTELKWNWHHDLICEYLTAVNEGQLNRLIINIAPRSTKSILATVCFPVWTWLKRPSRRYLFGSYSSDLATDHSVLRRNIIESDWFRMGYGNRFHLRSDSNTKHKFTNNMTGHMISAGIAGGVTGKGGHGIIIDDPHNPKGAESQAERETMLKDFDLTWTSRLNDKKKGFIVVIMQRLHENDLTGHLLAKNAGYTHLKIPTIAEERERLVFPISGRVFEREAGDYMHPERDGPKEIANAKLDMGPYGFAGQHQQSPVPSTGGMFEKAMFEFAAIPPKFDWTFCTADTAYKDKQENDFTVFSVWGILKDQLYLIDCLRKQIKAERIEDWVRPWLVKYQSWGFRGCYIEPKGHGIYLNQALRKQKKMDDGKVLQQILIPSDTRIEEFFADRKMDKVQRASNATPHLASRKIIINISIAQKEQLLAEALSFPKGKHDDFVDTMVDAIKLAYARKLNILDVL